MRFQKDTASAKSLNPIFSVMKFKKHKKLLFFSQSSFMKNMRFWEDTASAKSLNLIIFLQLLLNTSSYFSQTDFH